MYYCTIENINHIIMASLSSTAKSISELRTPCLIGYLNKIKNNAYQMLKQADKFNVKLTPHVKTHKTIQGAMIQTGGRRNGIVCSTLAEVNFFCNGGFDDILYAVPITPDKFMDAMKLNNKMDKFSILVDSMEMISALINFSHPNHIKPWHVWVMVDCGYHRDGIDPKDPDSLELIAALYNAGKDKMIFGGIYTHVSKFLTLKKISPLTHFITLHPKGGHSYGGKSKNEIKAIAEIERDAVVNFANKIRSHFGIGIGMSDVMITVGSTPTCSIMPSHLNEIDAIHPGNFIYYDCMQADLGSCTLDDIAVRVLTRVIGKYPKQNMLLIDCGWTGCSAQGESNHYGRIAGTEKHKLCIKVLKQEAGEVETSDGSPINFDNFPIGTILEILPHHSCASTHQHRKIHIIETDDNDRKIEEQTVMDSWEICDGW